MEIIELQNKILNFRDERNWKQFHHVKDVLLGLGIEVAELQEFFLWKKEDELKLIVSEKKNEISQEIADVFILLSYLSQDLEIDLEKAVIDKLEINSKKYPLEKSFGINKKYNEL